MIGKHAGWLGNAPPLLLHDAAARRQNWTLAWIRAALLRREKVFYTSTGDGLPAPLLEALTMPEPAQGWRRDLADQAVDDAHRDAAFASGEEAVRTVVPDLADLLDHESRLAELADLSGLRVLCRYDPRLEDRPLVGRLLQLHHRDVSDSVWGADIRDDRISICGEIDAFTADLLLEVLRAALAREILTLDLAGVQLLSAHGMGLLVQLADEVPAGKRLRLVNVPPTVLRLMALTGLARHPRIDLIEDVRTTRSAAATPVTVGV